MVSAELIEAHIDWNKSIVNKNEDELDGLISGAMLGVIGTEIGHQVGGGNVAGRVIGGEEKKALNNCPFCGEKFSFKKTPKCCPYCNEELGWCLL